MQRLLFLSGLSDDDPATTISDIQSIEALKTAWFQKSAHRLNSYMDMFQALETSFHKEIFSWVPYLFVYIANGIRPTIQGKERAIIAFLKDVEQKQIEKEYMQAVGFRYVGHV